MTSLLANGASIAGRLHPTDLSAKAGEMVAIIGPNGGGKTSLLRALAGVEQASGEVKLGSEFVASASAARRRTLMAFLPASRDMHWPIPALDVIRMGANAATQQDVDRVVEKLELQPLIDRPADQLSTGERTRVMLARCLVGRPALLMLDEPLSNLDPYWVLRIVQIMRQEADRGAIVLASLHDLDRLPAFDRAVLIADGKVQMDETPASLLASERFEEIFRVRQGVAGWEVRR